MASTARSLAEYELLIKSNVAPEEARFVLPQAMETTFIFTGSLNSWSKLVLNRMDSHAQLAVRSLALNIHEDLYRTYGKFYMDAYTNNVLLREADANY
jgi:thymidylate synthase (FAD)